MKLLAAAVVATAIGVRVLKSRHRRLLHPDGRSFTGELDIRGTGEPTGSTFIDRPGGYPATVRISRGIGSRPGRADILGVAIRVPAVGLDLLYSTAGRGRVTRHLPVPRHSFDTGYGTITSYRTGTARKVYLAVVSDPGGRPLGRTLESVVAAADHDGARLCLLVDDEPFGWLRFGPALPAAADDALAFDPIRNSTADLHPSGTIHGLRAAAYRWGQRWRGVQPPAPNPAAVTRTATHH